jgi:N-acetylneuraminate lyase
MASQYKGLFVAANTPMDAKRELVLDLVPKYVEYLHKNKVDGVYAVGSTGEFPHLTVEERKKLQKKWIQSAEGKIKVIVQVGANNIKDTVELVRSILC